ncbi:MAG: hypothetical protein KGD72_11305 [Candidatus Lokiarchaeota archaeon]|nr:hypothetical protein [Candidatus Lokiarchaeota archaeon]
MTDIYDEFIVYDLQNTGDRTRLNIKPEELQNHLDPEQVLIIIREDLRRIFIWKGSKSPVRKRFISSRVAQDLQRDLIQDARYHRCKIISIDQGDELQEFLSAFRLESMEVTERLPDMRYVRNIERDRLLELERVARETKEKKVKPVDEYYSPILEETTDDIVMSSIGIGLPLKKEKGRPGQPSRINATIGLAEEEKEKIKEKILKISVPENMERQNLILGHALYGAVSKVTDVFGKNVVEIVWEEIKTPKGVLELDENIFRVYFDDKKRIVEAVEVLKKIEPPAEPIVEKPKPTTRRELPKIPSNED